MDTLLIVIAVLAVVGGVLMAYWDDLMIAVFQWAFGKVTEQQAWDMHYFHEEQMHKFANLSEHAYKFHKSRSVKYYRYAVRMHDRNERKAKNKD